MYYKKNERAISSSTRKIQTSIQLDDDFLELPFQELLNCITHHDVKKLTGIVKLSPALLSMKTKNGWNLALLNESLKTKTSLTQRKIPTNTH